MWNCVQVKEEAWEGVSAAAEREGLYAGHEVKQELLVGPEVLQPQDAAFGLGLKFEVTVVKEELSDVETDGTGNCASSEYEDYSIKRSQLKDGREQLMLNPCFVHLEHIPIDKEQHSGNNKIQHNKTLSPKNTHVDDFEKINDILSKKTDQTKEQTFTCDSCGLRFTHRRKIIKHIRTCYKKVIATRKITAPFSCKICNKRFKMSFNLLKHEQIHSGLKPYKCEICDKQYFQSSHLSRHKKTHTSQPRVVETHSCNICSKKYRSKYDLAIHTRVHTGQMPYICQCCGKQFNKKSTLDNHERTHLDKTNHERTHVGKTENRSHFCEICNKWFATKWNLTKHTRSHTKETPYSCNVCCKKFMHNFSLTKHNRSRKHALKTELLTNCPKKDCALKARNK